MKTIEERKEIARIELDKLLLNCASGSYEDESVGNLTCATLCTITELLQPSPSDSEVEEAIDSKLIKLMELFEETETQGEYEKREIVTRKATNVLLEIKTLIRRASQPSCDKLVEALEYARGLIQNSIDDGRTPRGFLCTDGGMGLQPINEALAEHRKDKS